MATITPELEKDCPCPNTACPRHKNCAECIPFHEDKPKKSYCQSGVEVPIELKQRVSARMRAVGKS